MVGTTVSDTSGLGNVTKTTDSMGSLRNSSGSVSNKPSPEDVANAQQAKNYKNASPPNMEEASRYVANINDQNFRIQTFIEIYGSIGDQSPPAGLFEDGNGGIKDPNSLFFMMILYMDNANPKINWSDIVMKANDKSKEGSFIQARLNDSFLPINPAPYKGAGPNENKPISLADAVAAGIQPEVTTKAKQQTYTEKFAEKKEKRDVNKNTGLPTTSSGAAGDNAGLVIWPFQNLPIIPGGISKSVDWESSKYNATGFAEGGLTINGGAKNIEIEVEFNYAVGIPGIGDNIPTDSSATKDGNSTSDQASTSTLKYWTVEDLMGVCYLAQSLVFPWESTKMIATKQDINKSAGKPYFPIVFLRHYSLFPYLFPFVVTSVKIVPDENQPLIITNKNRMNMTDASLNYSAIRQTVKITMNLMSASGYAGIFQGDDSGVNIQAITSGKKYRELASKLLSGRI